VDFFKWLKSDDDSEVKKLAKYIEVRLPFKPAKQHRCRPVTPRSYRALIFKAMVSSVCVSMQCCLSRSFPAAAVQEKDIPLTLTQLIPIAYHKEHHHGHDHDHGHGKIQFHDAPKVTIYTWQYSGFTR